MFLIIKFSLLIISFILFYINLQINFEMNYFLLQQDLSTYFFIVLGALVAYYFFYKVGYYNSVKAVQTPNSLKKAYTVLF